jgi:hypothetical protein
MLDLGGLKYVNGPVDEVDRNWEELIEGNSHYL